MSPNSPSRSPKGSAWKQLGLQIVTAIQQLIAAFALIRWMLTAYIEYLWTRFNIGRWSHLVLLAYLVFLVFELILHTRGVRIISGGSLILQVVFATVLLVSSVAHYKGWRERIQQVFFIHAAARIAHLLAQAQFTADTPEVIIDRLLGIFRANFERKGAGCVNIFLFDSNVGKLVFHQAYPPNSSLDRSMTFREGEGGAGTAYAEKAVVYIPWRRFGSAIVVNTAASATDADEVTDSNVSNFAVLPKCFVSDKVEAFESVLTVPVVFSGACYGVLNLDSQRANAFRVRDFAQASFYGMVIGLYLHELNKSGRSLQ